MTETFTPIVYVLKGCPFCMKLRLFLVETGHLSAVRIVEVDDGTERQRINTLLTEKLDKATYPSAEIALGEYLNGSDALIDHFAAASGADLNALPTYQAYAGHVLPRLQQLYRENAELKQRAQPA